MFNVIIDWRYGVNPYLVGYVDAIIEDNNVDESRIKVVNESEILITNGASA